MCALHAGRLFADKLNNFLSGNCGDFEALLEGSGYGWQAAHSPSRISASCSERGLNSTKGCFSLLCWGAAARSSASGRKEGCYTRLRSNAAPLLGEPARFPKSAEIRFALNREQGPQTSGLQCRWTVKWSTGDAL